MVDNYGAWLGRQLQRQGMTQTELAAQVNVTRAAVSTWVSGRVTPRPDTVKLIEEALGVVPGASLSMDETVGHERLTWYHRPAHVDGGREYGNAAAFAFDADLSVLAREATQNSLDEILDTGRPVRIRHVLHEISGERLDAFRRVMRWDALREHYESAASAGNKASRALARALRDIEDRGSLVLLRVDDYNANGLTGDDYDDGRFAAVVRRQLDSVKSNASAGGSFGLGKATLWSASSLGMVLINSTLSRPHDGHRERRLIGRIDLPWHTVGDQAYAGPAWLGEADPDRDGAARSWWADEATVEALHLERDSDERNLLPRRRRTPGGRRGRRPRSTAREAVGRAGAELLGLHDLRPEPSPSSRRRSWPCATASRSSPSDAWSPTNTNRPGRAPCAPSSKGRRSID